MWGALGEGGEGGRGRAARCGEKHSAIARLVFTFTATVWRYEARLEGGGGCCGRPRCSSYLLLTRKTKPPPAFFHSRRDVNQQAGPARDSHRAHRSVIFVDGKQVWVSGHFLRRHATSALRGQQRARAGCRRPEHAGLVKLGRAADCLLPVHTCAEKGGGGQAGGRGVGVPGPGGGG